MIEEYRYKIRTDKKFSKFWIYDYNTNKKVSPKFLTREEAIAFRETLK